MSNHRTKPIIILGMHRSGTSCLAGILQQAGLYLGDVSTSNKYNVKGNRENPEVMKLNNDLLQYNNGDWDSPTEKVNWNESHLAKIDKLINQFENNYPNKHWGFKDPRILLTFPFWDNAFPNSILIGTIRNPIDVAHSLHRRDSNYSIQKGLDLWLSYNKQLLLLLKKKSFPLISFDYTNKIYQEKIDDILYKLFPSILHSNIDFFDNSLRTLPVEAFQLDTEIEDCYTELKSFLT